MKILIFSLMTLLIFSCEDIPDNKVPSIVQNTMKSKFPSAIDIDWSKKKNYYGAEFDLGGIDHDAYIDSNGKLLLYKIDISKTDLPSSVINLINSKYSDYKIEDAEKIEKDNIIYYQAELEKKGKKDTILTFSADGLPASSIKF